MGRAMSETVIKTAYVMTTRKRGHEGTALGGLLRRGLKSGVEAEVVVDPGSSPYTCYREILERSAERDGDARWLLSMQDDCSAANGFLDRVNKILAHAPDGLVSFYNPTNKGYRQAAESGKHVYRTRWNFWPQCHAFPRAYISDFLEHTDENFPAHYYSDDGRIKKWLRDNKKLYVYAIVPSMTQHLGAYRSSLDIPGRCGGQVRNSFNFAPSFDVSAVDWESEFANPFTAKDSRGFMPYDGYLRSVDGDDLSAWTGKSGEKVKK